MARTLNNNRPTASVGSNTAPPSERVIFRAVSSSAIGRASSRDLASRSSFVTTQGVAGSTGGEGFAEPGSLAVGGG